MSADENRFDEEFVRKVARLARIDVSAEELHELAPQFAAIEELVSIVQELDVPEDVDAATQAPVGTEALRPDEPGPVLTRREIVDNAAAHDGAFFVVPRFFEEE